MIEIITIKAAEREREKRGGCNDKRSWESFLPAAWLYFSASREKEEMEGEEDRGRTAVDELNNRLIQAEKINNRRSTESSIAAPIPSLCTHIYI